MIRRPPRSTLLPYPPLFRPPRFPLHVPPAEHACVERPAGALSCPNHDALEVGHGLERIIGNVPAAVVPVERRVDVGAGVGEQLDLADLERRGGGVAGLGRIARPPVADPWHGETGIG